MMRILRRLFVALALVAGLQSGTAQVNFTFHDTFSDSSVLNYYHTDRTAPLTTTTASFDGDWRLQMTVDGSKTNAGWFSVQGNYRSDSTTPGSSHWNNGLSTGYSVDFYVDPGWANDSLAQQISIWSMLKVDPAAASALGSDYYWPLLSYWSKTDNTAAFLVYPTNGTPLGVYAELSLPSGFGSGWHTITYMMEADGNYWYVDGSLFYKDTYYYADFYKPTAVESVYIQGRNYGSNYTIYVDNVKSVPEPSALMLVAGGTGALLFIYRRRRRSGTTS